MFEASDSISDWVDHADSDGSSVAVAPPRLSSGVSVVTNQAPTLAVVAAPAVAPFPHTTPEVFDDLMKVELEEGVSDLYLEQLAKAPSAPTASTASRKRVRKTTSAERRKKFTPNDNDRIVWQLLADFGRASADQLAVNVGVLVPSMIDRLRMHEDNGYIVRHRISTTVYVYTPTAKGLKTVGSTMKPRGSEPLKLNEFAHDAAALNLFTEIRSNAEGFETEEEKFASVLRTAIGSNPRFIPERLIKHAHGETKAAKAMSPKEFREYRNALALDPSYDPKGLGSEMESGNEWLFMLSGAGKLQRFVPDAVVRCDRAEDGSTRHVAIEVELSTKTKQRLLDKYRAYKADRFFSHIVFMTHDRKIADLLDKLDREDNMGLQAAGKLSIVRYPYDTINLASPYSWASRK